MNRYLAAFVIALGLALGLTHSVSSQGPVVLRKSTGEEAGTSSNPLRVDVTGSTTQPVNGTVTANMGTVTADPFGANADAASATGSISAKLRFIAGTGIPITGTVTVGSHAVTNAGTFAVQATEADGANTVLGSKADAKSTATDTTAITIMSVLKQISASVQGTLTVGSHAVTNAGTFAVQAAITAASGAFASGSISSGAVTSGAIASGAIASGAIASGAVASGAFASDSASFGVSATGAAPPAKANFIGGLGSGATGGFLIGVPVSDTFKAVSITSGTTTLMVTGVSGRHVRIGSVHLVTAIANNVAFISGTGATCGTGTAGMAGGTTAANGYNFAANGGLTLGTGLGTVMQTVAAGDSVCLVTSSAGPLAGTIAYAIY
jgi:hypothetical protein